MEEKNLYLKYGITKRDFDIGLSVVMESIVKICNPQVMVAIVDLLTSGDIDGGVNK